ncbi:MAG TPA: GntR family transcriptional regulator [Sandaracinaceae bacterium LLY-WYZ-13_1]|nr:GntR family transcriptional regulator [Sandaracinaceae bacterium LLY-WYZ-13_1]
MTTRATTLGTGRKADRVADDLLRRIVAGELEVGSLLPKEAELAARYEVNRSVIREAIKLLEVHRLVHPIRRRGTEVLDPMASMSPEVLRAMLVPEPGRVDRDLLADFLDIRTTLDLQMSTLAARHRTDADLEAIDACLADLADALYDRPRYDEVADRLSLAVARATHNRVFEMLVWWNQQVATDLQDIFRTVRPANEPHLAGLRLLVDLIRRREVEQVRALVAAFHEWATPRLLAAAALSTGEPLAHVMEGLG